MKTYESANIILAALDTDKCFTVDCTTIAKFRSNISPYLVPTIDDTTRILLQNLRERLSTEVGNVIRTSREITNDKP